MKTKIITNLLVISLCGLQMACSSEKFLNSIKHKTSTLLQEDLAVQTEELEKEQVNELILTKDSSSHSYQVKIIPLETFSYSVANGFRGKASRIEISGMQEQLNKVSEAKKVNLEKHRSTEIEQSGRYKEVQVDERKLLEKQSQSPLTMLLWILIPGLLVWGYLRFRKLRF